MSNFAPDADTNEPAHYRNLADLDTEQGAQGLTPGAVRTYRAGLKAAMQVAPGSVRQDLLAALSAAVGAARRDLERANRIEELHGLLKAHNPSVHVLAGHVSMLHAHLDGLRGCHKQAVAEASAAPSNAAGIWFRFGHDLGIYTGAMRDRLQQLIPREAPSDVDGEVGPGQAD